MLNLKSPPLATPLLNSLSQPASRKSARTSRARLLGLSALIIGGLWQLGERPANASACTAVVTVNPTKKWVWITIYDVFHARHLDWGFIAPSSSRTWKSGNYLCGSFYHVRAEVKDSESPTEPKNNPRNLTDTEVQINPQLKNWGSLLAHMGSFALSGAGTGAKVGPVGVVIGATTGAAVGVISQAIVDKSVFTESAGSVTCLRTKDGHNFYWDVDDSCLNTPQPVTQSASKK